jgi:DNA polymerase-3 subunit gamma/tau
LSLALARKYRPSTFDDLVGQDAVSQTLSLALDGDRLSHAYLFSGLRGSGKTSTARIFAKALLCEQGASSKPCNECDHCTMANESRHMDIIEMDAASNRGIDDIKELIEHTKYKPSAGRYKIFIIDEVHMLTTQAFNALLKTLEEPPDFVKFILATTDPLKLPATILSRTQHFRFKKIPQKLVMNHMQHILELENIEYDKEALEIIARSGAGSLRDSLTLLDQAIVYSKNHVDLATVTNMLGIIQPALLDGLLDDVLKKDESSILAFIDKAGDFETEMIIDELTLHLKELLLGKDNRFLPMAIDRFFRILADAKGLLSLGSDGEFVLSLTLFKMIEALSIRDIDSMIHTLQKELSGIKAQEAPPVSQTPTSTEQVTKKQTKQDEVSDTPTLDSASEEEVEPQESTADTDALSKPEPTKQDTNTSAQFQFKNLIQKLYDRDYELGSCFERNITFENYADHTLSWLSAAEEDDKKALVAGWSIIKMFVQETFGIETKIKNIPTGPKKKTDLNDSQNSSSMLEEIEMQSTTDSEASKEKDPSTLLEEPMVKEIIELFDPKKVRIVRKS